MTSLTCKSCSITVRLPPAQVEALVAAYLREHPGDLVPTRVAELRLQRCRSCRDLDYGSTCRHCGCLVPVRARLADKHCPHPERPRW